MNDGMARRHPEISVIVPVYNVEKYLPECVDSILAQTFTNFELILVDDGSSDGCPALCDEAAKKDSRVQVIHKPNGGVSTARNAGLDAAKSSWIAFVDSDDRVMPQFLERLYTAAVSANAEIAMCGTCGMNQNGELYLKEDGGYVTDSMVGNELLSCQEVLCRCIFRPIRWSGIKFIERKFFPIAVFRLGWLLKIHGYCRIFIQKAKDSCALKILFIVIVICQGAQ